MKVSRNELNTALRRAYEGSGYDIGDYEDVGELITWSEMCGLDVFSKIELPPSGPKGNATPRLVYEGINCAVIDAGGADVCQYGSLASHLGFTLAKRQRLSTVHLENCRNPGLVLRSLSLMAQQGVYISAYWHDSNGAHGASFELDAVFPNYWCLPPDTSSTFGGLSSLTLLFTTDIGLMADAVARQAEKPGIARQEITAIQLAANYAKALELGITVDDGQWQAVNAAAEPIMVAATVESRQGAGPG